ncbi:MAG: helix-turn-helix transcriptional regulator [Thiohalobacteraceae bacterium]
MNRELRLRPGIIKKLLLQKSATEGRRVTYDDVAKATGYSWNTIERYANARVVKPSGGMIVSLARFFGVSPDDLYDTGDDPEGEQAAVA